jgi:hypothetical protein
MYKPIFKQICVNANEVCVPVLKNVGGLALIQFLSKLQAFKYDRYIYFHQGYTIAAIHNKKAS